jgi:hypothetical protein
VDGSDRRADQGEVGIGLTRADLQAVFGAGIQVPDHVLEAKAQTPKLNDVNAVAIVNGDRVADAESLDIGLDDLHIVAICYDALGARSLDQTGARIERENHPAGLNTERRLKLRQP